MYIGQPGKILMLYGLEPTSLRLLHITNWILLSWSGGLLYLKGIIGKNIILDYLDLFLNFEVK